MNTTSRRSAFTLVELLVVIGIIALLIAILLPALGRARAQAQSTACLANLRSLGQAINIYAVASKGSLPYGFWDGIGAPDGNTVGNAASATDWALLLTSVALGKGSPQYGSTGGSDSGRIQQLFTCPTAYARTDTFASPTPRTLHYSCHPRLMPNLDDKELSPSLGGGLLTPYKLAKVRHSSEIILLFDGAQMISLGGNCYAVANNLDQDGLYWAADWGWRQWNYLLTKDGMNLDAAVFTSNKDWPYGGSARADMRWRHSKNDLCNFLFCDGHAEGRRLKYGKDAEIKVRNVYVNAPR